VLKQLLYISILCLFSPTVTAQKESYNWYFGITAGLNFATGTATALHDGKINTIEGSASISDKNGNLLFYTDGKKVWNRQHHPMPNGQNLLGNESSTQSGVIVPQPGNDSIYYIFTVDLQQGPNGLNYYIVNMHKDNGLGDVVGLPVRLLQPTHEQITAVKHCNNKDIWIITRSNLQNAFYAWLITANGISASPVISITNNANTHPIGYLKASPNGKQLASAHLGGFTELGDFNNISGTVSNIIKVRARPPVPGTIHSAYYGVEFSPDSKYMYLSTNYYNGPLPFPISCSIEQFNVSVHDSASIENSAYTVIKSSQALSQALQVGADKKIYVVNWVRNFMSRINDPNRGGTACNYELNAVDLGPTHLGYYGLPTFIQSYFYPEYKFQVKDNCNRLLKEFTINNLEYVDSVKWNFDDPASGVNNTSVSITPQHIFSSYRTYNVMLRIFKRTPCLTAIDTVYYPVTPVPLNYSLGTDREVCSQTAFTLNATMPAVTGYLWNTGETSATITNNQPGDYWCKITLNDGCEYVDTISIQSKFAPYFTIGKDSSLCNSTTLYLKPTPQTDWQLLWQDGSIQSTYKATRSGIYAVTATNNCGSLVKSILVDQRSCNVFIPNAFTPNGDQKNDIFIVPRATNLRQFNLKIFNRYGELVFFTNDPGHGWDGNHKGKPALAGVYTYMVSFKNPPIQNVETQNGSFILIR
jgi:gliding motility-associated-like protein